MIAVGIALSAGTVALARRRRRRPATGTGMAAREGVENSPSAARPAPPSTVRDRAAARSAPRAPVTAAPVLDAAAPAGAVAWIEPGEAGVPRWRRQSLKDARSKSDRVTAPAPRRVSFATPAQPGIERCLVRYDLVPLLDHPDEVTGLPVLDLQAGDEVDVIGRRGAWTEVRTPHGAVGWLHRTTLDAVAIATSEITNSQETAELGAAGQPVVEAIEPGALDRMLAAIVAERAAAAKDAARAVDGPLDSAVPTGRSARPNRPAPGPALRRASGDAPG